MFHVKLAALKALEAEAEGQMTARTLHSELVYLMACTKHVSVFWFQHVGCAACAACAVFCPSSSRRCVRACCSPLPQQEQNLAPVLTGRTPCLYVGVPLVLSPSSSKTSHLC